MPLNNSIAYNINYFRTKNNFTQEQVAKSAGISVRTYHSIEAGEGNPTLDTLSRIAGMFKTSVVALLRLCYININQTNIEEFFNSLKIKFEDYNGLVMYRTIEGEVIWGNKK